MPQRNGPRHVIWTAGTQPEWDGVQFGDSKIPGPRHLRIGFKSPITRGLGARACRWESEHVAAHGPVSRRLGRRVAMVARRAHRTTAGRRPQGGRRAIRALGFPPGDADAGPALHAHRRADRQPLCGLAGRGLRARRADGQPGPGGNGRQRGQRRSRRADQRRDQ